MFIGEIDQVLYQILDTWHGGHKIYVAWWVSITYTSIKKIHFDCLEQHPRVLEIGVCHFVFGVIVKDFRGNPTDSQVSRQERHKRTSLILFSIKNASHLLSLRTALWHLITPYSWQKGENNSIVQILCSYERTKDPSRGKIH